MVFLGAGRMSWGCTRHAALVEVAEVAEVVEIAVTCRNFLREYVSFLIERTNTPVYKMYMT